MIGETACRYALCTATNTLAACAASAVSCAPARTPALAPATPQPGLLRAERGVLDGGPQAGRLPPTRPR
eukprot:2297869-Alexandrium_andersonii.AAC.1